jgi:glycogen debranching enzyme
VALAALRPHVEGALRWIDRDGDADGDGLQEYQTRAGGGGYVNQGWKDSGTAIVGGWGELPKLPIALCELQGYVIAAKRAWAEVLGEAFEDHGEARRLRAEATELAQALEDRFWWDDEMTYFLGLDGDKLPIETVASNPGHLLWAGAVDEQRADLVVARLLGEDMWTGWGIRTLSDRHPAYNPFSYQQGSVWPHDCAIAAAGFLRYGHVEEAWRVARGLFDAARCFHLCRLPEVFAGLEREPGSFPVQYLGANVPQAWASGAVTQLLAALAGLSPCASEGRLDLDPAIPDWLGEVEIRGLRVGSGMADLLVSGKHSTVLRAENLDVREARGPTA